MVDRSDLIDQEEVIWLRDRESPEERREALQDWMLRYDTQRPHQALAGRTPAERRAEQLGLVAVAA